MRLHLSRLRLDPRSAQVRAELWTPYEMHRTLAKAFAPPALPSERARAALTDARVLFRVDEGVDPRTGRGALVALVQSRRAPDWSELTVGPDYLATSPETRDFEPSFAAGERFAFRLRANPTIKRGGKRFGLYQVDEQLSWLRRKAEQGGFAVERAVSATERRAQRGRRRDSEVEHLAVRFDGMLCVADPVQFADTLASGIGSAKGFGFGLLSLARIRS